MSVEDMTDEPGWDEDDDSRDWEGEARAMGWHPLAGPGVDPEDAYRGPIDKWTDARTYVETAETRMPVLRHQLRRNNERLIEAGETMSRMQKTLDDQAAAIAELREIARTANDAGYNRAMAEIEEDKRAAVRAGDEDAYEQAAERERALAEERKKQPILAPPPPPPMPNVDPAILAWEAENRHWFNAQNPALQQAMIAHHTIIKNKHPAMPMAEQLRVATAATKADFPREFGLQPQDAADPDDDGQSNEGDYVPPRRPVAPPALPPRSGNPAPRRPGASPFDAITDPSERAQAQAAFARIQRADPGYTADEYMRVYNNPSEDALALRRARQQQK